MAFFFNVSNAMSPPNQLTLLRILLTPLFAVLLFSESPANKQLALGIYVLAALTDWYDGWVARRWGYVTRWGKFFDPLADKVLTSTAFISFVSIGYAEAWMVWIIVVRDICITLLRSYGEFRQHPVDTSGFAKTKTLMQLFVIYCLLAVYVVRATPSLREPLAPMLDAIATPFVIFFLMLLVTLFTAATGLFYLWNNRSILKELCSSRADTPEVE
jgi:CDP-diacylglycerol---glycerol-3-phosphate 3-phosphatidyltransferase